MFGIKKNCFYIYCFRKRVAIFETENDSYASVCKEFITVDVKTKKNLFWLCDKLYKRIICDLILTNVMFVA